MADALATEDIISVKSGNGVGKSCLAACATLWFLNSFTPSIVLTTAPTERQVKKVMWGEIRHRKNTSYVELPGKAGILSLEINPIHYALGLSTKDEQKFQGFHNPNIMVIIDEANDYPVHLYKAIAGVLSGGERKVLFQIGNPISPVGPFFESFSDQDTWKHTISCLNHPNVVQRKNIVPGAVTYEWVERMRRLWGEESAFWSSRVLGQFPKIAADIVVNLGWVEVAELEPVRDKPKSGDLFMGYDVAEYGDDKHVWYIGSSRSKKEIYSRKGIEPMAGVGITIQLQAKYGIPGSHITVDGVGAGATIYSRLKEHKCMKGVRRFVSSEKAKDYRSFENQGTEAWWNLRGMLNPESDTYNQYSFGCKVDSLKADLCTRKFQTSSHGRIMLQPKKEYRKIMKRSPDEADSMAMCYSPFISRRTYGILKLPNVIPR